MAIALVADATGPVLVEVALVQKLIQPARTAFLANLVDVQIVVTMFWWIPLLVPTLLIVVPRPTLCPPLVPSPVSLTLPTILFPLLLILSLILPPL